MSDFMAADGEDYYVWIGRQDEIRAQQVPEEEEQEPAFAEVAPAS